MARTIRNRPLAAPTCPECGWWIDRRDTRPCACEPHERPSTRLRRYGHRDFHRAWDGRMARLIDDGNVR